MQRVKIQIAIIGAGPGGYVAAIRAGQLGKKVLVIEQDKLGGTCLNYGCIPTKTLLSTTEILKTIKESEKKGIKVEKGEVDLNRLKTWKNEVVNRLIRGIEYLFKGNRVESLQGEAKFFAPHQLEVKTPTGELYTIEAEDVIIATGSEPIALPDLTYDGKWIISSKEALELENIPEDLLVVGGGAIGLEIATIYSRLGSKVTIVELMEQILPGMDKEIATSLRRILEKEGIKIFTEAKLQDLENQMAVISLKDGNTLKLKTDQVLIAVGRKPLFHTLNIEILGLHPEKFIGVNEKMQTQVPHIYAIGDVTGGPLLAHRASHQGIIAAEIISGLTPYLFKAMPLCVYTHPEVASVGLTEREAQEKGIETANGKVPFAAVSRTLTLGEREGFIKIIAEKSTGKLLGCHMLGPHVSELISEVTLAIENGATVYDLKSTVHPHPTLSEAIMEAAASSLHQAIHILNT